MLFYLYHSTVNTEDFQIKAVSILQMNARLQPAEVPPSPSPTLSPLQPGETRSPSGSPTSSPTSPPSISPSTSPSKEVSLGIVFVFNLSLRIPSLISLLYYSIKKLTHMVCSPFLSPYGYLTANSKSKQESL